MQLYAAALGPGVSEVYFRVSPVTGWRDNPYGLAVADVSVLRSVRIEPGTSVLVWDDGDGEVAASFIAGQIAQQHGVEISDALSGGMPQCGLLYSISGPIDMAAVDAAYAARFPPPFPVIYVSPLLCSGGQP